jgi:hypothetical protein
LLDYIKSNPCDPLTADMQDYFRQKINEIKNNSI